MLRILLLLLILANLLILVWTQGFLGSPDEGREPQRLAQQIVPEQLQAHVILPVLAAAPSATDACRLVKGLAQHEAQRLMAQVETPGLRFEIKTVDSPSNVYWVYIPPLPNRDAMEKKLVELKKRGVVDFSAILEEGADKFAISLGIFDNERLANDYFQEMLKRGVRSAKIQMRENGRDKTQLEVRGPVDMLTKQLPELLKGQDAASIVDCVTGG